MPDGPLEIILEMVGVLVESTVNSLIRIINLFGQLLESVGLVAEVGGPLGLLLAVVIVGAVGFFIAKIFLGGGKRLLILLPIGVVVAFLILLGSTL